jgi:hypothetical protein
MDGAVHSLTYGERLPEHGVGFAEAPLEQQRSAEHGQVERRLVMRVSVKGFRDRQRLPVETLRVDVVSTLILGGAKVDQNVGDERMTVAVCLAIHPKDATIE